MSIVKRLKTTLQPHPLLQPYILTYNVFEKREGEIIKDYYPDYHSVMCFDIDRKHIRVTDGPESNYSLGLAGPVDCYVALEDVAKRILQVIFQPYGAYYLFQTSISELVYQGIDAALLLPDMKDCIARIEDAYPDEQKIFALLDNYFLKRLQQQKKPVIGVDRMSYACNVMVRSSGNIGISQLCREINMSESSFRTHFKEKTGLNPKTFSRIEKMKQLKTVIDAQQSIDWIALCEQFNFFDQTHFIKSFKSYFGCTPSAYMKL